jgi:Zn-dependent membrane protease YugP
MIYDPGFMLLSLVGMGLVFLPQVWVKNTVATYRDHMTRTKLNGAELARRLLTEAGIHNVVVEATPGELSDHYDPQAYAVRLSDDNYYGSHVAALAIAAHEVGHAIQHAQGYAPVVIRSQLAPLAGLGSQFGPHITHIITGVRCCQWYYACICYGARLAGYYYLWARCGLSFSHVACGTRCQSTSDVNFG